MLQIKIPRLLASGNQYEPVSSEENANHIKIKTQKVIICLAVAVVVLVGILFYWVMANLPTTRHTSQQPLNLQSITKEQIPSETPQPAPPQQKYSPEKNSEQGVVPSKNFWNREKIQRDEVMAKKDPVYRQTSKVPISRLSQAIKIRQCTQEGECSKEIMQEDQNYMKQNFNIFEYKEELPICVVVPTFDNTEQNRYINNIKSILKQKYQNFKVLVIDDVSDDHTGEAIQKYLAEENLPNKEKVTIQINENRKMALKNIMDAAHNFCKPYDIMIVIDGDDYLLGYNVFKLFNTFFQRSQAWIVYSNFLSTQWKIGFSRQYPQKVCQENMFRNVYFAISHLRAFYTKLLLKVNESDLQDDRGNWLRAANDVSIFIPILQMSCDRVKYIPEISYFYNSDTGRNNHKQKKDEQVQNDRHIRSKKKYSRIDELFSEQQKKELKEAIYRA